MGIIKSKLVRPFKTYNIGHRAQKIISKEQPKAAPYYPSVYDQIKVAKEATPNFMEEHYKKDSDLYDKLKDIFVTSDKTENPQIQRKEEKPLPYSTTTPDSFEFGYWEPKNVPDGRCRFKEIIVMMIDHVTKKEEHNAQKLAEEYKLDIKDVENILEYFRVLQVFQKSERENSFREEDVGLPKMDIPEKLGLLDLYRQWQEKRAAEEERKKEKETRENDKLGVSQTDEQTQLPHKDKIKTDLSHRDNDATSSKIDKKKEFSNE